MSLNSFFKKISLAQFIVLSGISLRIIQIFKETYYLNVFENSNDLSLYISLKANMDFFLIFSSSVFFYESCYNNGKINFPIIPVIISIIASLIIINNNFILENNYPVFFLVFFGSLISVFTNFVVVLAKESGDLKINLFANGFENYILLFVIFIFIMFNLTENFILYTLILIISQVIISSIIFFRLKKNNFLIIPNFKILDSIKSLPRIFGSTIILISVILTRTLFETNTEIIIFNYSLIIANAPLLLIERFFEYSKFEYNYSTKPIYIFCFFILIVVLSFLMLFFVPKFDLITGLTLNKFILIGLKSFEYFLLLLPLFLYFIFFKNSTYFNKNAIIIMLLSYSLVYLFSIQIRSEIFLIGLSLFSIFFFLKSYSYEYNK
tara:strand:- start:1044 stop:2183 length:1140 start_codon:yes stop_codon:yes gene_type:complete